METNNGSTVAENGPVTPSFTPPVSELSILLKLPVNGHYGQSTLSLVQEALMIHRHACLEEFFANLKEGEYQTAYAYYQSFEDLTYTLDTMLTESVKLAAQNYYAEEVASNPGGYRNWIERMPADKADRYATFLKMVMPSSEYKEPEQSTTDLASIDSAGNYKFDLDTELTKRMAAPRLYPPKGFGAHDRANIAFLSISPNAATQSVDTSVKADAEGKMIKPDLPTLIAYIVSLGGTEKIAAAMFTHYNSRSWTSHNDYPMTNWNLAAKGWLSAYRQNPEN